MDSDGGCSPLPSCIQDPNNPNGFIASGARLEQDTTDTLERIQNGLGVVGGSSVFSNFKLDYHASFALGTDRVSTSYGSAWTDPNPGADRLRQQHRSALSEVSHARWHQSRGSGQLHPEEIGLGQSYTHDGETAGVLDATIPTGSGDQTAEWKFGLSVRGRHKTSDSTSPVFTPNGTISLRPTPTDPRRSTTTISTILALRSAWCRSETLPIATSARSPMMRPPMRPAISTIERMSMPDTASIRPNSAIGVLAGVRVESTHATYGGNLYDSDLDTNTPATERNSYTNYFPTLQARYEFLDNLVGRLTYSTGIARPGFEQITPGASISVSNAAVTVGNPALKPTLGQNFDLALEYYPGDGQIAAAGLFYKQFRDYILLSQQIVSGYPYPGLTGTSPRFRASRTVPRMPRASRVSISNS